LSTRECVGASVSETPTSLTLGYVKDVDLRGSVCFARD